MGRERGEVPDSKTSIRLVVLIASAFFMEFLDGTAIATALPQMARSFGVSAVHMNIGITAYLLTVAVCIPVSGWVADRAGARTVFASALAGFTVASLLCGLSHTLLEFTLMRILQGMAGAMMVPVGRLIVLRVTPPERLTEAIMYTQWPGLTALVIGPPLGGLITTYASWHYIFFLNIPLGIVATALALRWIANDRVRDPQPFDWLTFALAGIASTALVYALEVGANAAQWPKCLFLLGLSALSGLLAVAVARRRPASALIDLDSLRKPTYAQGIYGATAFRIAVAVVPFLLPLMFQVTFGLSAFRSGLYLLALFGGDMSMKAVVVPVLRRWGFRQVMLINGVLTSASLALCAMLAPGTPLLLLLAVLCGHGALRSLQFTCMGTLAFTDIPASAMSRANAFYSAVLQLGTGIGVPVGALCLRLFARLHRHPIPALADYHGALLAVAVLSLGPVFNSLRLPPDAGAATSGHRPSQPGLHAEAVAGPPVLENVPVRNARVAKTLTEGAHPLEIDPRRSPPSLAGWRLRKRLTWWDIAGMATGLLLSFAITVVISRHRIFWEDEMLGWMLLRDPSWHHMLFAYRHGADGGGFSFYLLGRLWFGLFGPSELAFRLFSSTCFGLAFSATWAAARRYYGVGVVTFALFNTWFFSPPFVAHMAEGRFYGLLVLAVSLAIWLTLALAEATGPTPPSFYLATFLTHGLLTSTHLLGVVFSVFLLGTTVALDRQGGRSRPWLYLAGATSWLLLIPERANILATARVGRPWFWTSAPRWDEVLGVYTGSSKEIALVLGVLFLVAMTLFLRAGGTRRTLLRAAWKRRRPVHGVLAAMFLLGVAVWVEGDFGTWLFNNRYLLPLTVAVAYLTAEGSQVCLDLWAPERRILRGLKGVGGRAVAGVAFAAALVFWDFKHLARFSPSPEDYTAALTAKLPHGIPVICEDAFSFTELLGRQHASGVRYMYLLDWPQTIGPSAPRVEVTQYHLMENWRNVGYFSGSIEPLADFLRHTSEFLVVHAEPRPPTGRPPDIGNPLAERFASDGAFEVKPYAQLDRDRMRDTVFLVCRGRCSATP